MIYQIDAKRGEVRILSSCKAGAASRPSASMRMTHIASQQLRDCAFAAPCERHRPPLDVRKRSRLMRVIDKDNGPCVRMRVMMSPSACIAMILFAVRKPGVAAAVGGRN